MPFCEEVCTVTDLVLNIHLNLYGPKNRYQSLGVGATLEQLYLHTYALIRCRVG